MSVHIKFLPHHQITCKYAFISGWERAVFFLKKANETVLGYSSIPAALLGRATISHQRPIFLTSLRVIVSVLFAIWCQLIKYARARRGALRPPLPPLRWPLMPWGSELAMRWGEVRGGCSHLLIALRFQHQRKVNGCFPSTLQRTLCFTWLFRLAIVGLSLLDFGRQFRIFRRK